MDFCGRGGDEHRCFRARDANPDSDVHDRVRAGDNSASPNQGTHRVRLPVSFFLRARLRFCFYSRGTGWWTPVALGHDDFFGDFRGVVIKGDEALAESLSAGSDWIGCGAGRDRVDWDWCSAIPGLRRGGWASRHASRGCRPDYAGRDARAYPVEQEQAATLSSA